jgi:rubrerythrin
MQELKNRSENVSPSNTPSPADSTQEESLKGSEYEKVTLNPEDLEDRWLRWKCMKCGFVYEGKEPVNVCPKCGNDDPDLFDDAC